MWGAPSSSENNKNAEVDDRIHVKNTLALDYFKSNGNVTNFYDVLR